MYWFAAVFDLLAIATASLLPLPWTLSRHSDRPVVDDGQLAPKVGSPLSPADAERRGFLQGEDMVHVVGVYTPATDGEQKEGEETYLKL